MTSIQEGIIAKKVSEIRHLMNTGNLTEAFARCQKFADKYPESHLGWYLMGLVAEQQGNQHEAEVAWETTLLLKSDDALTHFKLGMLLQSQGTTERSLMHLAAARAFAPEESVYTRTLARVHMMLGNNEDLMLYARALLEQNPKDGDAFFLLGSGLHLSGKYPDAELALRQASEYDPIHVSASFQLGLVLLEQQRLSEAVSAFENTLRVSQGQGVQASWLARVWALLGRAFHAQGQVGPAAEAWQSALKLWPDGLACTGLSLQLPAVYQKPEDISTWREHFVTGLETLEAKAREISSPLSEYLLPPFDLSLSGQADLALKQRVGHFYQSYLSDPHTPTGSQKNSLTLVWLGISPLWEPALTSLAKALNALLPLTILTSEAELAERLLKAGLTVQPVPYLRENIKQALLHSQPDHLLYLDLRNPLAYSLALEKLAPVQSVLCLQPESTGLNTLDYFFSAAALEPAQAETQYSETLVKLKAWPILPTLPALPAWKSKRDLRITELGTIYLCPVESHKIHPDFDPALQAILEKDRKAFLYFLYREGDVAHTYLQQRLQERLGARADKAKFVSWANTEELLQYLHRADVVLDTPYCGGRSLIGWAMALGVPVISLEGKSQQGRWGSSLNKALGHPEFNADSLEKYPGLACTHASAGPQRVILKASLTERYSQLWNPTQAAQEIVAVLSQNPADHNPAPPTETDQDEKQG
ncbi:MAG: tetratricopeptide repeat protein [Candidatus Sericytochromatia bacterium]